VVFEPPLESAEAIRFSVRQTAERFVAQIAGHGLVCTQARIDVECDQVVASSRSWAHSRWFDPADLADRVHWQLSGQVAAGSATSPGSGVTNPVDLVRFTPETVEPVAAHAQGLWGAGTDERVERAIARVQGLLGHGAVAVPTMQGGRSPADQQALVPWGERPTGLRPVEPPWPGSLPPPAPARIFAEPWRAEVVDAPGRPVRVDIRGIVSAPPARFCPSTALAGGGRTGRRPGGRVGIPAEGRAEWRAGGRAGAHTEGRHEGRTTTRAERQSGGRSGPQTEGRHGGGRVTGGARRPSTAAGSRSRPGPGHGR
jgi:protein ImuB